MSLIYGGIILKALWLAMGFLGDGSLRSRLVVLQSENLVENFTFHAPYNFVVSLHPDLQL